MSAEYICELCGKENFTESQGNWREGRWLCDKCIKKLTNPDVITILEFWLRKNGFDGLYQPGECGCEIGELCPCGEPAPDCQAGYKGPGQDGYDFMIGPEKN